MSVQGRPEAEVQDPPHPPGGLAAGADPVPTDPHHARRWLILGVILIAQVMILLDSTIINVALPSAQKDLGFSNAPASGSSPPTSWPSAASCRWAAGCQTCWAARR